MTTQFIRISPRDPLIARDGRPFMVGNRMTSLDWFYPSVVAGSLRSLIGKQAGDDFSKSQVHPPLKEIAIGGPFPESNGMLYLPAPKDIALDEKTRKVFTARPEALKDGEGTDMPSGLQPAFLNSAPNDMFKPGKIPEFWSVNKLAQWLATPLIGQGQWSFTSGSDYLSAPQKDERFHVQISNGSGTADDGMLFSTSSLDLLRLPCQTIKDELTLILLATATNGHSSRLAQVQQFHPLGGERRLAHWQADLSSKPDRWKCPSAVANELLKLKPGAGVRLMLATPGLFDSTGATGWYPEWVGPGWTGTVPGTDVSLKLVSVCMDRWKPFSGWNLETNRPRASRRLVPAGSVYFFEYLSGTPQKLADTWLHSICGNGSSTQEVRDGFGLALWGVS